MINPVYVFMITNIKILIKSKIYITYKYGV